MLYQDYLKKVSKRFLDRFEEIDPEWNFDQGNEFEVTLAYLLEELLPDKYGVCRGFITPAAGKPVGDDIIIYDKASVPLLKPPTGYKFTRKENVPVEAVYTYIEAKNTLELKTKKNRNHISKAIKQVSKIKQLGRADRPLSALIDDVEFGSFTINQKEGFPNILNPMYTVLFARGARISGKLVNDPYEIKNAINGIDTGKYGPDLIVIGKDLVIVPHKIDKRPDTEHVRITYESPFCIDGRHELSMMIVPDIAYGFGLASILNALKCIKLQQMPWETVLAEPLIESHKLSEDQRKKTK